MKDRKRTFRLKAKAAAIRAERAENGGLKPTLAEGLGSLSEVLASLEPLPEEDRMPEIADDDLLPLEYDDPLTAATWTTD